MRSAIYLKLALIGYLSSSFFLVSRKLTFSIGLNECILT